MKQKFILILFLLALVISGCLRPSTPLANSNEVASPTGKTPLQEGTAPASFAILPSSTATQELTRPGITGSTPTHTPTSAEASATPNQPPLGATATPTLTGGRTGPDSFPAGINPLTGLPVSDSARLQLPPALVSITNFPPSARPQAGLSYSAVVYELYIGEGMTRFLAVFYGEYPPKSDPSGKTANTAIGPIRSGRLPYEKLRLLYSGFLVMASGYRTILERMDEYTNIFGSDKEDINSAMVDVAKLEEIASKSGWKIQPDYLTGQVFDPVEPAGGKPAQRIWIPFSFLNQVLWRYDPATQAYHRYQDQADGKTFVQATDRINGEPLTYENVVVLFVDHHAQTEQVIDLDFMYITKMPALLFRDGKLYEIFWTTRNQAYEKKTGRIRPIRFIDAQGNPFPLKPGQTWIELMPRGIPYQETIDSQAYFDLMTKKQPGSGNWAIYFSPPPVEEQ